MTEPSFSSSPRRSPRPRAVLILGIAGLSVILLAAGAAVWASSRLTWCAGAEGPREDLVFVVESGVYGERLLGQLEGEDVVRDCGIFTRYLARGKTDGIMAGEYRLTTNMTLDGALAVLKEGPPPIETVTATFPEGLTVAQTGEVAARELKVPAKKVVALAESGTLASPPYLPEGTSTAEGFLFPKTYEFIKGEVDADQLVARMLEQFEEEARGLPWANAKRLGVDPYEAVVIASMIEREAANDAERPLVAAVIYNRLASGTPLYIDATLQYIDPDPSDGLTLSDLAIRSPYNTRLVRGLPPTPIASPGRASLKAALQPANVDFEYYVLCGQTHRFTSSYEQFLTWKDQCL